MIRNQNKVNNQKNSIVKTNSLCLKVDCKTETITGQENDNEIMYVCICMYCVFSITMCSSTAYFVRS